MAVRNGARFLPAAISSITTQTFADLELIIVDDGSDDLTPQILARASEKDSRIKVLRQPRLGLVAALTAARKQASGHYIARMDADDISCPDRLARQIAYLDSHPSVVALGGQVQIIDEVNARPRIGRFPVSPEQCRRHLDFGSPLCHPAVTMRHDALERCGAYRARFEYAEDFDLWLRLADIGKLANLNRVVLHYRAHDYSVTVAHARNNARAAAIALLCHRHTVTAVPASLHRPGADERSWSCIEREIAVEYRLYARAAYLRGLILNGAITREAELSLLMDSIRPWASDPLVGPRRDVLAFMIVRGFYQLYRVRRKGEAGRLLKLGLRHFPAAVVSEAAYSMSRRVSLANHLKRLETPTTARSDSVESGPAKVSSR